MEICRSLRRRCLVFSKTLNEHVPHLQEVFNMIREAKPTLKPGKCHFAITKLSI